MQGMGLYGAMGIVAFILGLAKEIFIIALLFQGIRVANIFIKKNKDGNNPPLNVAMTSRDVEQDEKDNSDQ